MDATPDGGVPEDARAAIEAGLSRFLPPYVRSDDENGRDLLVVGKLRPDERISRDDPERFAALLHDRFARYDWIGGFNAQDAPFHSLQTFRLGGNLAGALAAIDPPDEMLFLSPDARLALFWPHYGDARFGALDTPGWFDGDRLALLGRPPIRWSRREEEDALARRLRHLRFRLDRPDLARRPDIDHLTDADPVVRCGTAAALITHPDLGAETLRAATSLAEPHPWIAFGLAWLGENAALERLARSPDSDVRATATGLLERPTPRR